MMDLSKVHHISRDGSVKTESYKEERFSLFRVQVVCHQENGT